MGLPIITAVVGLGVALATVGLVGHVVAIPSSGPTLATMIGLGVGIDYALFLITRHQDQLRDGIPVRESIANAVATSGSAIVFAGCTVVIALLSLGVAGIPLVSALGLASAIAVVCAVLVAISLLPAFLGLLGPRINRLALPAFLRPKPTGRPGHVGALGRRGPPAPAADRRRVAGGAGAADHPGVLAPARPGGHRRDVAGHDRAPGLRPDHRRLRGRLQRSAAGGLVPRPGGQRRARVHQEVRQGAVAADRPGEQAEGAARSSRSSSRSSSSSSRSSRQSLERAGGRSCRASRPPRAAGRPAPGPAERPGAAGGAAPAGAAGARGAGARAGASGGGAAAAGRGAGRPDPPARPRAGRARGPGADPAARDRARQGPTAAPGAAARALAEVRAREAAVRQQLAPLQRQARGPGRAGRRAQEPDRPAAQPGRRAAAQAAELERQKAALEQQGAALQAEAGRAAGAGRRACRSRPTSCRPRATPSSSRPTSSRPSRSRPSRSRSRPRSSSSSSPTWSPQAGGDPRGTDPRVVNLQAGLAGHRGRGRPDPAADQRPRATSSCSPRSRRPHRSAVRPPTWSTWSATTVLPATNAGRRHRLVRRRLHRVVRRPRHPDHRPAAAGDRDRDPARLPAADGGVPLAAHPVPGRDHQPALGRGGVRRAHRRLPVGLGHLAARHRHPRLLGPDRELRAADDVRRAVRAVDGLRGVPGQPRPACTTTPARRPGRRWPRRWARAPGSPRPPR